MAATLAVMPKRETAPVRIEKELLRKIGVIAAALGKSVPEYVEERMQTVVDKEYPKIVKGLVEEIDQEDAD